MRLRAVGSAFLLIASAIFVFDAIQESPNNAAPSLTSLHDIWTKIHPESLELFRATAKQHLPSLIWDPETLSIMQMPLFIVIGLLGIIILRFSGMNNRTGLTPNQTATKATPINSNSMSPNAKSPTSELAQAFKSCRRAFLGIGLFSGMSNILMLSGAFFMLQVYDRVLPSRSVATLIALAILVAGLLAAQGILDMIRSRILLRIGASLDEALSARVYNTIVRLPLVAANRGDGLLPLRDLDQLRSFLSGQGSTALFDLPWLPIYLAIIFSFHSILGMTAFLGAIVLVFLTIVTEWMTRAPMSSATNSGMLRIGLVDASRRNAEVLTAMGMMGRMGERWGEANKQYMRNQRQVNDVAGGFGAISKALRMMLQSAVLGVGAYLVINGEATAGIIIAGAILAARALAPVDLAIANWKGFVAARQSWTRLSELLETMPSQPTPMPLPAPAKMLSVVNVSAVPPGAGKVAVVQDVSFELNSGNGLGIIGPSASGKSSLIRLLVGVWQPARGKIRLDGAELQQWEPDTLGYSIGYLPQNVELFSGTVAENISRFESEALPETIIAAARAAGVHDLVVRLSNGYETELGDHGQALSAGQRQRIALARALYRDPFLIVLDEPNSNLDAEGETALTHAILGARERGAIVVVVAHRPSALAGVDLVLAMAHGRAKEFGPKDDVLAKALRPKSAIKAPLKVVPDSGMNKP